MTSIWCVDDEKDLLEAFREILERRGHCVRTFARAQEVLSALYEGAPPQALFTDLKLPDGSGRDIIVVAMKVSVQRIVLVSGSEEAISVARELNIMFLPKPPQIPAILAQIP